MTTEDIDALNRHLIAMSRAGDIYDIAQISQRIIADPQAHVDALVEAGVLEDAWAASRPNKPSIHGDPKGPVPRYRVVQPEPPCEHYWRVTANPAYVNVKCKACGEVRHGVRNRLPIEVPT